VCVRSKRAHSNLFYLRFIIIRVRFYLEPLLNLLPWRTTHFLSANPTLSCQSLCNDQGKKHMDAAEYCLKYLAGTVDLCIHYGRNKDSKIEGRDVNRLWGWVDEDFAADLDTRRLLTSHVIMMNGGPISWKSVKQQSLSLSTAESEWYAKRLPLVYRYGP